MKREPIFLMAPTSILVLAGVLIGMHLLGLSGEGMRDWLLVNFAFIPALFTLETLRDYSLLIMRPWSIFTYALLHANWTHLLMNTLWLLAFGSPVAKRLGAARFYVFCLLAAPAGALAHYLVYQNHGMPIIGASAVVSALTAAAVRFAFDPGGPLMNRDNPRAVFHPAAPFRENMKNPQVLFFIVTWFAINFIFGAGATLLGPGTQIAWQAHIGGFLAGLLLFSWLDPVKKPLS